MMWQLIINEFIEAGFIWNNPSNVQSIIGLTLDEVPGAVVHVMKIPPYNVYVYYGDTGPVQMGPIFFDTAKNTITAVKTLLILTK